MSSFQIPFYEKQILLSHILKKPREYVLTHPDIVLLEKQKDKLDKLIQRRLNHEPIAYILGQKGFYGLDFSVSRNTLIPRPETEHLVEKILQLKPRSGIIIDIGSGSGNIIISIAYNLKQMICSKKISFFGIDINKKTLNVAKSNAKKYNLEKEIKFIKSDLLNYFINNPTIKQFNNLIIVANLPYLSKKIYKNTAPDIKKYEPKSALLSGTDGLNHYRKLLKQIKLLKNKYPKLCIACCIEFSPEQKLKISKLIKFNFPKSNPRFIKDLTQRWRVVVFKI